MSGVATATDFEAAEGHMENLFAESFSLLEDPSGDAHRKVKRQAAN
jgi:hypothetical protein